MTAIQHTMTPDQWAFWRAALNGKSLPDFNPKHVPIGFYRRVDRKTGIWKPIAIWIGKTDGLKHVQNAMAPEFPLRTAEEEEDFSFNQFAHFSKHPISHDDYKHWMANEAWPAERNPDPPSPAPGDNTDLSPEQALAQFVDQVDSAVRQAETITKVETQDQGNILQGYRTRLTTLAGEGGKLHKAEKAPHLAAGRAVDDAWFPHIRRAEDAARAAKRRNDDFVEAERRRQREQQAAQEAAGFATTEKPAEVVLKGASGRAARTKEILIGTIVDQDAFYQIVRNTPDVVQLLEKLKDKIYRTMAPGMPDVAGCTSEKKTVTT